MAKGKLKMLFLARIFMQETDDEHRLTLQQIADRLGEHDIRADRKTLYQDFEELRQFGFDIISEQIGHNTYYHLGARDFELPELKLLVDSVQAARFITDRKSRALIRKLEGLTSRYRAQQLQRQVLITGRVKAMNESIYYNIDKLHEAINEDRQISFQYCQWNINKEMKPRRKGQWYQVSPWALCWTDDKYYLVAYDDDARMIKYYRVDKMQRITIVEDARLGQERFKAFDIARYAKSMFGMFTGDETEVILQGENSMIGVLIDRFGKDIPLSAVDEDHFEAKVSVALSAQFLGWIMSLGRDIRITGPEAVVQRMRDEIRRLSEQYDHN
ncbi:MAG: helix-turn-helix transcriptional regulator [bacterium]